MNRLKHYGSCMSIHRLKYYRCALIHREIIMGVDSTLEMLWVRIHRENIMGEQSLLKYSG